MWTLTCRRPSDPSMPKISFYETFVKPIENQQKCLNWTPSHAGIFKKHQQNKANAKTVPTTFWTPIWEPEMDFDYDFKHVAQTLQIPMFQLILAFLWHHKTAKYSILTMKLKHFWTVDNSSFWILPTTSASSPTFHLNSPSESNSCLTHIEMFKKR